MPWSYANVKLRNSAANPNDLCYEETCYLVIELVRSFFTHSMKVIGNLCITSNTYAKQKGKIIKESVKKKTNSERNNSRYQYQFAYLDSLS